MPGLRRCLLLVCLWSYGGLAAALSNAPLQALNAYIEGGSCSRQVVDWNRNYNSSTMAGETARGFYYRVLGFTDWGPCGRPFFQPILAELQKAWLIFSGGLVAEPEFEAKEAELINLLFAALADEAHAAQMVADYEANTSVRIMNLVPSRQYFNCTFFGERVRCTD